MRKRDGENDGGNDCGLNSTDERFIDFSEISRHRYGRIGYNNTNRSGFIYHTRPLYCRSSALLQRTDRRKRHIIHSAYATRVLYPRQPRTPDGSRYGENVLYLLGRDGERGHTLCDKTENVFISRVNVNSPI